MARDRVGIRSPYGAAFCLAHPMSDLHIRCAAPTDIDAVLRFWRTAAEGTSISDDRDGVGRLVARDPEALLLAERDGVLVGTVIAGFDGWRCSAYRLAVAPECRRQGIATALTEAAEQRFAALGGRRVDASTPWSWRPTSARTVPGTRPATAARTTGGAG